MKKLLIFLGILVMSLLTFTSFAQLTINQSFTPTTNLKVGDTLSVKYTVDKGTTTPRYFWLRYQFNNKALTYVSTVFSQGSSVQTFYTGWSGYKFTASTANSITATSLYAQYLATPWGYVANADWNAGQLTVQRTDASINGDIATQKYIIKDLVDYTNIHKLDLAYSIDATSASITPITTNPGTMSLGTVRGGASSFKVRVLFPTGYTIADHGISLLQLNATKTDVDWTKPPLAFKQLDASGEATFTTEIKVGDTIGLMVSPPNGKTWMNNIITVSDAYKAFLGIAQTDINGTKNFFQYNQERLMANVSKDDGAGTGIYNETDAYYLFSHVMGIDVSTKAYIPSSTATSLRYGSSLLNQGWLDGTNKYITIVTSSTQAVDMVFSWNGDLDFSHSSSLTEIASRIATGNYANSIKGNDEVGVNKSMSVQSMSYNQVFETAKLSLTSTIVNGKVVLTGNLTKEGLAGLEVILQYDNSKLTFDNISFDAGPSVTNFSTNGDGRLTFGSMDQTKTARIKTGTPYKLTFTPKETITNTAGLFYTVLSDAVDGNGNKINLTVE
jgi:hypothetical protein